MTLSNQALTKEIEQRKQAEEALRQSEERFRELAEFLPEAVFQTDLDFRLTYANRRAFELFGYTREDFEAGLSGLDMLGPADRVRAKAVLSPASDGDDVARVAGVRLYLGPQPAQ